MTVATAIISNYPDNFCPKSHRQICINQIKMSQIIVQPDYEGLFTGANPSSSTLNTTEKKLSFL